MSEYRVWHMRQLPRNLQNEAHDLLKRRIDEAYSREIGNSVISLLVKLKTKLARGPVSRRPRMVLTKSENGQERVLAVVDYNPLAPTVNEIATASMSEEKSRALRADLGMSAAEALSLHLVHYLKKFHEKNFIDTALLQKGHDLSERIGRFGFRVEKVSAGVTRIHFPKKLPKLSAEKKWTGRFNQAQSTT